MRAATTEYQLQCERTPATSHRAINHLHKNDRECEPAPFFAKAPNKLTPSSILSEYGF